METTIDLATLGRRLGKVDALIFAVVKRRMQLALQVERRKQEEGGPIVRSTIENDRITDAATWAKNNGLNPHFAASLENLLILESCHEQLQQMQDPNRKNTVIPAEQEYELLKQNLIALTERWSTTYEEDYEKGQFGTQTYLQYERSLMEQEILQLPHRGILLDLGCATGRLTRPLSQHFSFSVGYDISHSMVNRAYLNAHDYNGQNIELTKVAFQQADLEHGIDKPDNSVSYVVMNLGTASDMRDISGVIKEIMRVLKPGGKFFLSFYNREALIYRWEFIPWPVGLTASINLYKNCLEVYDPATGREMSIYARPYTKREVEALLAEAEDLRVVSYPAMSMLLPSVLFDGQPDIQESIEAVDKTLLDTTMGAYLIATGTKR